jgi:hypothetical protein
MLSKLGDTTKISGCFSLGAVVPWARVRPFLQILASAAGLDDRYFQRFDNAGRAAQYIPFYSALSLMA